MAKTNTADVGFEKQIWSAADKLRGSMDASEYKHVVLGLIFLKYISDRFEQRYQELVAEGYGMEEDKDEYTSQGIFWVPQEARWETIASNAHTPEVGIKIDDAMRLIEKENARLKGILPKNFARPEMDKQRLGDVVDLFTNINMKEHGVLPFHVRFFRGQECRRILYPRLHRPHPRGSAKAVSWTRI